jgi:hypothetical protein
MNDAGLGSILSSHMTGIVHIHFFSAAGLTFFLVIVENVARARLLKREVSKFDDDRNKKREIRRKNKPEDRIRVKFARNSSTTTISQMTESLVIASDIRAAKRSIVNDADDEMNRINVDEEKKRTDSEKTRIIIMSDHESVRRDEERTEATC